MKRTCIWKGHNYGVQFKTPCGSTTRWREEYHYFTHCPFCGKDIYWPNLDPYNTDWKLERELERKEIK